MTFEGIQKLGFCYKVGKVRISFNPLNFSDLFVFICLAEVYNIDY